MVELGQAGRAEAARQRRPYRRLLDLVAEEAVVDVAGDGRLVDGESLERRLHAVIRNRLPHDVDRVAVAEVGGRSATRAQLEPDLLARVVEAHHRAGRLEGGVGSVPGVAEEQLVTSDQPQLGLIGGESEVGQPALVERHVPPYRQRLLRLGLPHLPVVLGLEPHERAHDGLVLVGVLVLALDGSRLAAVESVPLGGESVGVGGGRVGPPQLLEPRDLRHRAGACAQCLRVGWLLDKPRDKGLFAHERLPLCQVPVRGVLDAAHVDVAREQHDEVLLDRHEPEREDVLRPGQEALERDLSERRLCVQRHLVVARLDQVVDDARGGQPGRTVVAEPAPRRHALDHRRRSVHVAVAARPRRQLGRHRRLTLVLLHKLEAVAGAGADRGGRGTAAVVADRARHHVVRRRARRGRAIGTAAPAAFLLVVVDEVEGHR
mmetsp:Transcript_13096/g.41862  ORF Transcript_13096/g.41862 Transcript_13096/m.41862 type:complete len:433 (+) Transcript_13096:2610-3908(+)